MVQYMDNHRLRSVLVKPNSSLCFSYVSNGIFFNSGRQIVELIDTEPDVSKTYCAYEIAV